MPRLFSAKCRPKCCSGAAQRREYCTATRCSCACCSGRVVCAAFGHQDRVPLCSDPFARRGMASRSILEGIAEHSSRPSTGTKTRRGRQKCGVHGPWPTKCRVAHAPPGPRQNADSRCRHLLAGPTAPALPALEVRCSVRSASGEPAERTAQRACIRNTPSTPTPPLIRPGALARTRRRCRHPQLNT